MSLPCQVKQPVPVGPAKRPWRQRLDRQRTLTLRAWQKRWASHGNVPNWKSRRRWRWWRFNSNASFHANVYFPFVSSLFTFEYLLVLLEAGFFKSKSSCRNPDSNLEVFSFCLSILAIDCGRSYLQTPSWTTAPGRKPLNCGICCLWRPSLTLCHQRAFNRRGNWNYIHLLIVKDFGMKFLHIIFKWWEGELLTMNLSWL